VRILFFLLIAIILDADTLQQRSRVMMGTIVTLSAPPEKSGVLQEAFERIGMVEHALSSYAPDADFYRLNHDRNASIQNDTYEALQLCDRYYHETGGYFNIAVGAVTHEAFQFGKDERLPTNKELAHTDINMSGLKYDAHSASLAKGINLDLGGMGKGFAADKAYDVYREHNVTAGRIALSGDIRCVDRCTIAVAHPFEPDAVIAEFESLRPGLAVSTSGNYRRYVGEKTNNHLIDPHTHRPQQRFASVTLLSYGSSADLDAYATAAAVMPVDEALAFLKRQKVGFILYTVDRKRIVSDNISRFSRNLHFY
jgi:thiamine biosynthesis lipoprotein